MGLRPQKEKVKGTCGFCHHREQTLDSGVLYKTPDDEVAAHFNCMLFSPPLVSQCSPDSDSFGGFLLEDVKKEIKRGQRLLQHAAEDVTNTGMRSTFTRVLRCNWCKKSGATVGCDVSRCKKSYHYVCALKCDAYAIEDEQNGIYKILCARHRPDRASNGDEHAHDSNEDLISTDEEISLDGADDDGTWDDDIESDTALGRVESSNSKEVHNHLEEQAPAPSTQGNKMEILDTPKRNMLKRLKASSLQVGQASSQQNPGQKRRSSTRKWARRLPTTSDEEESTTSRGSAPTWRQTLSVAKRLWVNAEEATGRLGNMDTTSEEEADFGAPPGLKQQQYVVSEEKAPPPFGPSHSPSLIPKALIPFGPLAAPAAQVLSPSPNTLSEEQESRDISASDTLQSSCAAQSLPPEYVTLAALKEAMRPMGAVLEVLLQDILYLVGEVQLLQAMVTEQLHTPPPTSMASAASSTPAPGLAPQSRHMVDTAPVPSAVGDEYSVVISEKETNGSCRHLNFGGNAAVAGPSIVHSNPLKSEDADSVLCIGQTSVPKRQRLDCPDSSESSSSNFDNRPKKKSFGECSAVPSMVKDSGPQWIKLLSQCYAQIKNPSDVDGQTNNLKGRDFWNLCSTENCMEALLKKMKASVQTNIENILHQNASEEDYEQAFNVLKATGCLQNIAKEVKQEIKDKKEALEREKANLLQKEQMLDEILGE